MRFSRSKSDIRSKKVLLPRWPLGAQPNRGEPPPIAQEIEMVVIDLNTLQILPKTYTGHKGFTDSTVGQNIDTVVAILSDLCGLSENSKSGLSLPVYQ